MLLRETLVAYCSRMGREELLEQWELQANLPLTPERVSHGSKQKVWWRCQKGHVWRAAIHTRTGSSTGCPVCAGKIPLAGETDLASRFPQLARQWHPTRNGTLTPEQVLPGSHKSVWWLCQKGHVWQAQIKSRTAGCGCPVCAGRKVQPAENDLTSRFPYLAAQWHPSRNGVLTPEQVSSGSRRKVWWLCQKGHSWQATIASRTSGGSGCPYCTGKKVLPGENDLASRFPELARQWHPTLNGALTPDIVSPATNRKVWWCCENGHAYQATAAARTIHASGCPYCSGRRVLPGFNDLASREPEIAAQWHPVLNGTLTPEMVTVSAHRKVWWQCSLGHVWKAAVYARTGARRSGCPICAGSAGGKRQSYYTRILAEAEAAMGKGQRSSLRPSIPDPVPRSAALLANYHEARPAITDPAENIECEIRKQ